MFLDEHRLLHMMDTNIRFSAGILCDEMTRNTSARGLLAFWITQFWTPHVVREHNTLNRKSSMDFVKTVGSNFEPLPARPYQKNILKSKHGVIRSIYLRLKEAEPDAKTEILAIQAIDISNQL